jgi:hypothetical protein
VGPFNGISILLRDDMRPAVLRLSEHRTIGWVRAPSTREEHISHSDTIRARHPAAQATFLEAEILGSTATPLASYMTGAISLHLAPQHHTPPWPTTPYQQHLTMRMPCLGSLKVTRFAPCTPRILRPIGCLLCLHTHSRCNPHKLQQTPLPIYQHPRSLITVVTPCRMLRLCSLFTAIINRASEPRSWSYLESYLRRHRLIPRSLNAYNDRGARLPKHCAQRCFRPVMSTLAAAHNLHPGFNQLLCFRSYFSTVRRSSPKWRH